MKHQTHDSACPTGVINNGGLLQPLLLGLAKRFYYYVFLDFEKLFLGCNFLVSITRKKKPKCGSVLVQN